MKKNTTKSQQIQGSLDPSGSKLTRIISQGMMELRGLLFEAQFFLNINSKKIF